MLGVRAPIPAFSLQRCPWRDLAVGRPLGAWLSCGHEHRNERMSGHEFERDPEGCRRVVRERSHWNRLKWKSDRLRGQLSRHTLCLSLDRGPCDALRANEILKMGSKDSTAQRNATLRRGPGGRTRSLRGTQQSATHPLAAAVPKFLRTPRSLCLDSLPPQGRRQGPR